LTPRYWRNAERRHDGQDVARDGGSETAEHQRALTADHHQPGLGGQRDAERGQDERRGADEGVLP
jgi:hypothetical protein